MISAAAASTEAVSCVGFVVIGRNEGDRLEKCLRSLLAHSTRVVYADSASTDGSAELARRLGVETVVLDGTAPFTAARGRNAGYRLLRQRFPECEFVQFVDGDCILAAQWLPQATAFLQANPRVALACGRRFEAHPDASLYNRLCDREWNTPIGRADLAGGDALVRVAAFEQTGGFRSELTAGEEPEITARMRAMGWEIWRLDVPMTEHDARILRFSQWWRRALRGGFGYAQVWSTTGNLPQRVLGPQLRGAVLWALGIPFLICAAALVLGWELLLLLPLIYLLQVGRIAARNDVLSVESWRMAAMTLFAKFPEAIGALRFFTRRAVDPNAYKEVR